MKKFVFMLMVMLCGIVSAQNVPSSAKFTDNWSVAVQGGILTPYNENEGSYFKNISPVIGIKINKEFSPWFGVGVDARTLLNGEGYKLGPNQIPLMDQVRDSKTTFDAVNVSANARFNLTHIFYPSKVYRRTFEPVVYTGFGWGHSTDESFTPWSAASQIDQPDGDRNYMTYRAGCEFNFNLGQKKAWAVYVDPSIVWGNIRDMRLDKRHSNIEVLAGVKYYFKTSNGTHSWVKHVCPEPKVVEIIKDRILTKETTKVVYVDNFYRVGFAKNKAELTSEGIEILNKIPEGSTVKIYASASPEGTSKRNTELVKERAIAVGNYLSTRSIRTVISEVEDSRQALIEIIK